MNLPSTKASFIILLVVILSTLTFVFSDFFERKPVEQIGASDQIVVESQIDKSETNSDSDGDGLLNWEESLWGTDPYKYDTDGDGTNDSEELEQKRNPLVAGPDDEDISPEERILREIEEKSLVSENSLTNRVAVGFADNYFTMRGENGINEEEKSYLVDEIINESLQEINFEPKYSIYSIKTFNKEEEPEKLLEYAKLYIASQILVLSNGSSNNENNYLEIGNNILKISKELSLVEVPEEIKKDHLELINNLDKLGQIMKGISKENEDPLYVLLLLPSYEKSLVKQEDINNRIGSFLKQNGIIVKDNLIQIEND